MMDSTNGIIVVNDGEASFPAPEELRDSSTSRTTATTTGSTRRGIWSGVARADESSSSYDKKSKGRYYYCKICTVVVAVLVLLVIVPAVVVSGKNRTMETNSPKFAQIAYYMIRQGVTSEKDISNGDTLDSPQTKAILWLANDDPANLTVPSLSSDISTYEGYMYMVRYVMAVNFFAMNGSDWENDLTFLSDRDVCDWNADVSKDDTIYRLGLFCATEPGETEGSVVTLPISLHIEKNKVAGTIPSEIGKLSTLLSMRLVNNIDLTGTIPNELCQLSLLRSIHLSYNRLTGQIPDCLDDIKELELLDLSINLFNNHIPETLCQISKLSELHLKVNALTGTIPPCFGSMPELTHFVVRGNQLESSIPTELCNAPKILNIDVESNLLIGQIPSCIGSLSSLEGINLSDNYLTGAVPTEWSGLGDTLRILSLEDNELIGDPSAVFNDLVKLRVLTAANNYFKFSIDTSFLMNTVSLVNLDISNNNISGVFPVHLLNYPTLITLDLSSNDLTGALTDDIIDNGSLEVLSVHSNMLTGSLQNVATLTKLSHLDLSNNRLTGVIDPIGGLVRMQNLFLSENPFDSGTIPASFGELMNLQGLSLRSTNRTGVLLDPNIENWKSVQLIDFGFNNLEGAIPENYGELPALQYLLLNDNEFINGDLPETFQSMPEIVGVFLDGTSITEASTIDLLCGLPNFNNGTGTIGEEIFIVNCLKDCTAQCISCVCCDATMDPFICSEPYFNDFDPTLNAAFRRTTNFYNVTEVVTSTFEDDGRY